MSQRFEVLELAILAAQTAIPILERLPPSLRKFADQGTRAVTSVPCNLSEGNLPGSRSRLYHFTKAYREAGETITVLRTVQPLTVVPAEPCAAALALLDRVRAMTWVLIHGRR